MAAVPVLISDKALTRFGTVVARNRAIIKPYELKWTVPNNRVLQIEYWYDTEVSRFLKEKLVEIAELNEIDIQIQSLYDEEDDESTLPSLFKKLGFTIQLMCENATRSVGKCCTSASPEGYHYTVTLSIREFVTGREGRNNVSDMPSPNNILSRSTDDLRSLDNASPSEIINTMRMRLLMRRRDPQAALEGGADGDDDRPNSAPSSMIASPSSGFRAIQNNLISDVTSALQRDTRNVIHLANLIENGTATRKIWVEQRHQNVVKEARFQITDDLAVGDHAVRMFTKGACVGGTGGFLYGSGLLPVILNDLIAAVGNAASAIEKVAYSFGPAQHAANAGNPSFSSLNASHQAVASMSHMMSWTQVKSFLMKFFFLLTNSSVYVPTAVMAFILGFYGGVVGYLQDLHEVEEGDGPQETYSIGQFCYEIIDAFNDMARERTRTPLQAFGRADYTDMFDGGRAVGRRNRVADRQDYGVMLMAPR